MPRLGIMTPSSNVNVEITTCAMLAGVPDITAHYSRFALQPREVPIDATTLMPAAQLLLEAGVDVLVFHGTAGSRTGLERDSGLCRALEQATGIPSTTASQATVAALHALGAETVSMIYPGPEWATAEIAAEYAREGIVIGHFAWTDRFSGNLEIGNLSASEVEAFVTAGIIDGVDAVVVLGTNLAAAPLVEELERRHATTIVDSTAATTWHLLRLVGRDQRLDGWGRLLRLAG